MQVPQINRKVAGNLLSEDSTFGTTAHIIAYGAYGDEMYEMDILELFSKLEDDFGVEMSDDVRQKLQAIMLCTQSDAFFHDPEAFRAVCNTLVDGDPGFLIFDDLTIPEILWSTYEVSLNHPGVEFTQAVNNLIDRELKEEGEDLDSLDEAGDLPYFDRAVTHLRGELKEQLNTLGVDTAKLPQV
jgi:hypothetical protein